MTLAMAVVVAAAVLPTVGGPAVAESLREALAAAYLGNPGIRAERARQRSTDESVHQALSGLLPSVSLEAHSGYEHKERHPPGAAYRQWPGSYGVKLSQPLYKGLRTLNATRRARADVMAGQAQLYHREQSVLLEAATAFADVFRDREIVRLRRENVRFLRSELKATQTRVKEGDLTRTDVAQARSRLQKGLSDLAQAEANVESSNARFASLIGHLPGPLARPPSVAALLPSSFADAVRMAEKENPALLSAAFRGAAARYQTEEAYGELLPTVSLDAYYGKEEDHSVGLEREHEKSVFVRMSMPLYQGGKVRSRVRESRQTEVQRQFEITDTRSRIKARLQDAWQQRKAARARIRAQRLQVEAARDALKGVQIEASVGERAFFEVLDAQRELVNARAGLKRAERDHVVAEFSLLAATGRLTPSYLELPAPTYDPRVNLKEVRFTPFGIRRGHRAGRAQGRKRLQLPPTVAAAAPRPAPQARRAARQAKVRPAPATGWTTTLAKAARAEPEPSQRSKTNAPAPTTQARPTRTSIGGTTAFRKRRKAAKPERRSGWRSKLTNAP